VPEGAGGVGHSTGDLDRTIEKMDEGDRTPIQMGFLSKGARNPETDCCRSFQVSDRRRGRQDDGIVSVHNLPLIKAEQTLNIRKQILDLVFPIFYLDFIVEPGRRIQDTLHCTILPLPENFIIFDME
jgi:hypothetical protein